MPNLRDIFVEYIGSGELIHDGNKIPVNFECQQLWDGDILGNIELLDMECHPILDSLFHESSPFKILGSTIDGHSISIESINLTRFSMFGSNTHKFIANEVKAKIRDFVSDDSEIIIIFGITNFQSFKTFVNTNMGELRFNNYSWR